MTKRHTDTLTHTKKNLHSAQMRPYNRPTRQRPERLEKGEAQKSDPAGSTCLDCRLAEDTVNETAE